MENFNARYARHYSLKDIGKEGQQKLASTKVLVVGAGGLGCATLQYLAAAGVGTIGLVDHDKVSLSNLQRQILYATSDIGKDKTTVATAKLQQLNPEITILGHYMQVDSKNALSLLELYDIVVDCTDNFTARYIINDACFLLNKPLIFGAVYQYEGQVAIFNVPDEEGHKTNYRNVFETPPDPLEVADCNEAGVIGVLPGMIGIMQASEVIKLITGIGEPLINKLLTFSMLTYDSFIIEIESNTIANRNIPKDKNSFESTDYSAYCSSSEKGVKELESEVFLQRILLPDTIVIDVRESYELPNPAFQNINLPLSLLNKEIPAIEANNIILFCQSGKRSLKAGQLLVSKFGTSKKIAHLSGGIISLQEK